MLLLCGKTMSLTSRIHCRSKGHIVPKKIYKKILKSPGHLPLTNLKDKKETNHKYGWFVKGSEAHRQ